MYIKSKTMETYSDKLMRIKEEFDVLDPFTKEDAYNLVRNVLFTSLDTKKERMCSLVDFIFARISDKLGVTMGDIISQSKEESKSKARHIYAVMLYIFSDMNHTEIANHVGHKNHTTVNYSRRKAAIMIEGRWNPEMNMIVDLYMEIKHIAQDLGVFERILPDWFQPNSYKDEVLSILKIGPIRRKKSKALLWFKSYTKYGKAK